MSAISVSPTCPTRPHKGTDSWSQRTAFVGFDWASDHHDVVLVDQHGKVVEEFRFDDTAEGWQLLIKKLREHPVPAVAIETSSGATVERLLEAGYAVYPVNPKAAKRYRERKAPCGTKTDRLDAWSLADALRLDGHTWRLPQVGRFADRRVADIVSG